MGFLSYLSPGLTAATQVAGGYAQGKERVRKDALAEQLLAIKQKRQDEQDAMLKLVQEAQIARDRRIGVTYQPNAKNDVIQLPTSIDAPAAGPTKPVAPQSSVPATPAPEGAPIGVAAPPSESAIPSAPPTEQSSAPIAPQPSIGTPTGFKGPPRAPVPGSPEAAAWEKTRAVIDAKAHRDYAVPPSPTNVYLPSVDPTTGKTTYTTVQSKGAPNPKPTGIVKPETVGGSSLRGLGQGGVFGAGSGIGAVREMQAANPNLKTFEKGFLADGPQTASQLGALDRFRQRLANDLQTHGLITAATASEAERELAQTNPDLVVYGRNLKQWIVSDLNLSRSATDKRGALDMEVSGLSVPLSSMPPAQRSAYINQIWEARDARLSGLQTAANTAQVMLDRVTGKKADPTAGMSDADAWEVYRQQGMTAAQATAKVQSRKK